MSQRLLMVSTYFPPDERAGGAEFYAARMAGGLARDHGWDVTVISTTQGRAARRDTTPDGLTVHRLPYQRRLSNSPVAANWPRRLRRLVTELKPDVVNVHLPVPGLGDLACFAAAGRPVVVNYHFGSMKKGSPVLDLAIGAYEHLVLPAVLSRAARVVCTSDYVRTGFLPELGTRACTISPAVDLERFRPAPVQVTAPHVLYVGSLSRCYRHKRFTDLLAACQILRPHLPDLRLSVVGGGGGRAELTELAAAMGLTGVVDFRGRLSGEDLARAYREAAVFALPSLSEAFGMVAAEAMASGLPVVAVNGGGIPELVADGRDGLLVPARDPAALATALRALLTNPDRAARLGLAARRTACERLRWPHQVGLMNTVLAGALR